MQDSVRKNILWECYQQATPIQKNIVIQTLTAKPGEHKVMSWEGFLASQNTSYDRKTMRRIDHVIRDSKPWYVPTIDLYVVAEACYQLGVCDGKRAERARNKQKMRNLYHFIETL